MTDKFEILAPHVDDEVIGCFRLLEKGEVEKVHYFFELGVDRRAEAMASARFFNFTPVFHENEFPDFSHNSRLIIPNINDNHIHHKTLNRRYRGHPQVSFYSVDMNVNFEVLSEQEQRNKEYALKSLFPSQAKLLENEKYFLFESMLDTDAIVRYKYTVKFFHSLVTVEMDSYVADVSLERLVRSTKLNEQNDRQSVIQLLNLIVSIYSCNVCKVSCTSVVNDKTFSVSAEI